jgi:acetyl/propionyl-CoA carboxylase alpha subunit
LVQENILDVAHRAKADAIHPGYGFLSENANFAQACADAGYLFIGPPAPAIRAMGDKTAARLMMKQAGVPMAPGTPNAIENPADAAPIAATIGYPVLIKAAAGGGGKGMRIVNAPKDFERSMEMAQREALSAFGDGRVYIEKYIQGPRHIEFQILADAHGQVVHLFERECSIQRRHQKVIEEAPSSILTPERRAEMGEAAVLAAQACGYVNAGTVEFLIDQDLNFYFMEMNTRLQVEHPVTECITGLDLVAEQIRIAEGEPLGYAQSDLSMNGHAIECRVYAEDPIHQFLPDPGTLIRHVTPDGLGVRVDAGIEQGMEVQIHYDPMISKLITWGRTRPEAIRRMQRALSEYEIAGLQTTIPFCNFVMHHNTFQTGNFTTHFVQDHFTPEVLMQNNPVADRTAAIAAVLFQATQNRKGIEASANQTRPETTQSQWVLRRKS